eukprot:Hpha_TRINITY_DN3101_c0_g1::TRINITY_DN3101_c0_g1_i1::g.96757::m.96757
MPDPEGDFVMTTSRDGEGEDSPADRRCSRIGYAMFLLLTFAIGLILRSGEVANMFKLFPVLKDTCNGETNCLGVTAVYRVSFSLFLFYLGHMIFSLCISPSIGCVPPSGGGTSEKIPLGFRIGIKVIVFLLFLIIPFFIPQDFFKGYAWVALVCGVVFLLMQSIILLDFAYGWNEAWAGRAADRMDESRGAFALIFIAFFIVFAIAITLTGLMYKWFVSPDSCTGGDYSRQCFLVTFNLLTGVLHTLAAGYLSVKGYTQTSILPSAVVFLYCSWQIFSAIMAWSGDSHTCNSIQVQSGKLTVTSVLSTIIAAIALAYAAINAGSSRSAFALSQESANAHEQREGVSDTFFFFCMLTGAGYLAMVLTGWDVEGTANHGDNDFSVDGGKTSMWVKVCTSWFTLILYVWSIAAPVCCPDRFRDADLAY